MIVEMRSDDDLKLRYAIEEAFSDDFTSLKERYGIPDKELEKLRRIRKIYLLEFEDRVKYMLPKGTK